MRDDIQNAPVVRFLNKVLHDAVVRDAKRIKFERHPKTDAKLVTTVVNGLETVEVQMAPRPRSKDDRFSIAMEFDSGFEDTGMPPVVLWEPIIRRIKVMAKMIDYGLRKTDTGDIHVDVDGIGSANYRITSNPNPDSDNVVVLERDDA